MKSNGVLLLAPTKGNGGINTWTRTYLKTFDSKNYSLFSITFFNLVIIYKVVGKEHLKEIQAIERIFT